MYHDARTYIRSALLSIAFLNRAKASRSCTLNVIHLIIPQLSRIIYLGMFPANR